MAQDVSISQVMIVLQVAKWNVTAQNLRIQGLMDATDNAAEQLEDDYHLQSMFKLVQCSVERNLQRCRVEEQTQKGAYVEEQVQQS